MLEDDDIFIINVNTVCLNRSFKVGLGGRLNVVGGVVATNPAASKGSGAGALVLIIKNMPPTSRTPAHTNPTTHRREIVDARILITR